MVVTQTQCITRRRLWQTAALITLVVLLSACSVFGRRQFGATSPLEGSVVITCSEECASRGQCGDSVDRGTFVFAGSDAPRTEGHDVLLPVAAEATLLEPARQEMLEAIGTGERFPIYFYHVILADQTKAGWVAGWCVANR